MDGSSFLASFASASTQPKEQIQFNGGAIDSFPVKGSKVTIIPSPGDHELGSSKLQISNIVNFGWDYKYFAGQLVAVHKSGSYFAYGIVSAGKNTGIVRLVKKKTEQRVLLKGMKGKVKDLAFAHSMDQIILGVVDEFGNLFVFKVHTDDDNEGNGNSSSDPGDPLETELILQVNSSSGGVEHRLIWCPYLPEEDDDNSSPDDTSARLLVLTHGADAEMWNIDMVIKNYGSDPLEASSVTIGRLVIKDHGGAITDASFSPDGTALATASADGQVKFFQVYMLEHENPRCLHQWAPHDGQPLSCLFFLDDHREYNPDEQFWKYAITGCNHNNELKLWSCESWSCLQTIEFLPSAEPKSKFKAALDLSAQFLLLSDIAKKNVYVLHLKKDNDDKVSVVSASEFATPSPFLSLAVLEAGVKKVADKHTVGEDDSEDEDEPVEDPQGTSREATVISFLLVQPKSLQECRIVYDDAVRQPRESESADREETPKIPEAKSSNLDSSPGQLKEAADKITLMSPEVFASATPKINISRIKTEPESPPKRGAAAVNAIASGGSSPSGEVQDILGDSEEQGGITAEIIVTEENIDSDEDDDDDEDDDIIAVEDDDLSDDDDDLSDEFANIPDVQDKFVMKPGSGSKAADDLEILIKKEIKQEPIELDDNALDPLAVKLEAASLNASLNASVNRIKDEAVNKTWPPPVMKQEQVSPGQPMQDRSGGSPILSGNAGDKMPASEAISKQQMEAMMSRLADMTALIQTQRAEMQVWKEEMRQLRKEDVGQFKTLLDESTSEATAEIKKTSSRDSKAVLSGVVQSVNNSVANHLKTCVNQEIKKMTPQIAQATAQALGQTLGQEVQAKVLKSDTQLRDAIHKMANSKTATDAIANAVTASVTPALQAGFRDAFANVVVPAFERSMQNLFAQLSTTFNKGMKEYESQLKHHVTKQVTSSLEPLAKDLREATARLNQSASHGHNDLEKRLTNVIRTELRHSMARSVSATPTALHGASPATPTAPATPTLAEIQATVNLRLTEGRLNDAFATALSANNLKLVVTTCEHVNPMQIFNQHPCPLSQQVLLSLIQQLGHNLEEKTEIKHKYLEEAIMNLDTNNAATRSHIPAIMTALQKQLQKFIAGNANQKITRSIRMLLMATQSFTKAE